MKYRSGISFPYWQHKRLAYVFISLHCLLHSYHSLFPIHFTLSSILLPHHWCFHLVHIQKASKSVNLVSHFHWNHFHWCYFLFPDFFCLSQFYYIFCCRLELIKMFLATLTSWKYVHVSKWMWYVSYANDVEMWALKKKCSFFKIGLRNLILHQLRRNIERYYWSEVSFKYRVFNTPL